MEQLFEFFGIKDLRLVLQYRLILSSFAFLTFTILLYFWTQSRRSAYGLRNSRHGLLALSLVYLAYGALGFSTVYLPDGQVYLVLSGVINTCFLVALPFLSTSHNPLHRVFSNSIWIVFSVILGTLWILALFIVPQDLWHWQGDLLFSTLGIGLFGAVLVYTFLGKGLRFFGILTGVIILFIIWLQFKSPEVLGEGRFYHMNTVMLSPALFMAMLSVAYAFSWYNEQIFREMAQIYIGDDEVPEKPPKRSLPEYWKELLAEDNVEGVIEQVLSHLRWKNQPLNLIINLAQRNTRNNTAKLKATVQEEEYQVQRNKISDSVLHLVNEVV